MKKKMLAGLLTLAMSIGMLAGCGAEPTETSKSTVEKEETVEKSEVKVEESKEEAVEPVEIVWYRHTKLNDDEQKVTDAINEYIEPLIGVRVKVITNQNTDLKLALAAGEEVDLFWTANWNNGRTYISGNVAYDLTDLLQNYEGLYSSMPEIIWENSESNGKNYFVPVYKEAANGYSVVVPTAIVDKYGWDLSGVDDLLDLTPFLKDVHEDGMDSAWSPANAGAYIYMWKYYDDLVGSMLSIKRGDDSGTVVSWFDTPEYEEYCKTMYEWNQAGYIHQEDVSPEANSHITKVQEGRTAFAMWSNTPDGKANASARYGMELEVLPITPNFIKNDSTFGSAYMINAKTEKVDACLKLLELLYTDEEFANLATFGIEGEHWNKTADGRVELIADSGYATEGVWATTNVMAPSLLVGESADKKEQYAVYNENALGQASFGFTYDRTPIDAEMTAVSAVIKEYRALLENGFYDPEEYLPKLREGLKKAGIDKVIEEVQNQYNAWLESK